MASIKKRGNKYCVIYKIKLPDGTTKQKWETKDTKAEAEIRKAEIEYKMAVGEFEVPICTTMEELLKEYVDLYGLEKWAPSTYSGNLGLINNYILPTIGKKKITDIDIRFLERYYKELLTMPSVRSTRNLDGDQTITPATVTDIHKLLKSCFKQARKWGLIKENPALDATVPKYKAEKREIWTTDMLQQAIDACDNKLLRIAFHMSFVATLRMGELLGLTWDAMDISEEAIAENRAYIIVNKQVERISKKALDALEGRDVILIFPTLRKNNTTVRVMKTPKTETSNRKVYIPKSAALCLVEWKKEQDEVIEILGSDYMNYNLVMASSTGLPIGDSYLRDQMQRVIDKEGLPDVVFHSLRHTSVTYKLKLTGGDIKAVQGDSGHAQADMVTDVYSHILDEDRRRNAELIEEAFYNKKEPTAPATQAAQVGNSITVPEGIDAEALMKVLANPEMAALLTSLAKTMKSE